MNVDRATRLHRVLLVLSALAAVWALIVVLTGGFIVYVYSIPLSSRNPRKAVLIALVTGVAAWVLSMRAARRTMRDEWLQWREGVRSVQRRWPWLRWGHPAVLVALLGIGMEVYQWAMAPPLWLDEEMIALNVRDRSLVDLEGPLWLGQSAPFGWLVLQRAVLLTFGTCEHALRLVPVSFGLATLVAAVWIGRRWMGAAGAVVLVVLCAFGRWLTHYPLEVKHYSADVFWGLLLPALAAWTIEADRSQHRLRHAAIWWTAAALGQWLANGALLVTPACAVVVLVMLWRRAGWRPAVVFASFGSIWLASFGLHYLVALRHTVGSAYLRSYWSAGFPPESAGTIDTLSWLASRFEPIAVNPGSTELWLMFWLSAAYGFALSARPAIGAVLCAVPLSAFALAALGLVPMYERQSLWIVPALYFGVALCCDSAVRLGRDAVARRGWMRLGLAVGVLLVASAVSYDIFQRGKHDLEVGRPPDRKQGLDDRAAVRWLMSHRQHGDALITTHLALPAVWWYGHIPLSSLESSGSHHPDGGPIFDVRYAEPGSECEGNQLRELLKNERRVLVYSGFPEAQKGFPDLLFASLGQLGVVRARREFATIGRAAVIELGAERGTEDGRAFEIPGRGPVTPRLEGCVVGSVATRW